MQLPDTRTTPYINTIPHEAETKSPGDQDIEKKINSYQNSIWDFFNKTMVIYLEYENEALIVWKENDQQSIFIKSEAPKKDEIN